MTNPDAPRNDDERNDPQDDTTFATTAEDTADETTADDTKQLEQTVHSDTTEQFDRTEQLDATATPETSGTRAIGVEEPATTPVLPERPSGPHAPAIVLGLVCLAVAGIILAQELGQLTVDWGNVGPLGIILTGAVLVLFGLAGLLTSRRTSKTS
ncbi:hypothetical protein [Pedococcus sp. P5_B7]